MYPLPSLASQRSPHAVSTLPLQKEPLPRMLFAFLWFHIHVCVPESYIVVYAFQFYLNYFLKK